jgi:heme A synthase
VQRQGIRGLGASGSAQASAGGPSTPALVATKRREKQPEGSVRRGRTSPRVIGMGHLVFAVALFVGLVLIVEWVFMRRDEKKRADRRF